MKPLPGFCKLIILYIESGNNRISREIRLVYLVTLCSFENFKPDEHKRDDKLEIKVRKKHVYLRRKMSNVESLFPVYGRKLAILWTLGDSRAAGDGWRRHCVDRRCTTRAVSSTDPAQSCQGRDVGGRSWATQHQRVDTEQS